MSDITHDVFKFLIVCKRCRGFLAWSSLDNVEALCNNCQIRNRKVNLSIGHRGNYHE